MYFSPIEPFVQSGEFFRIKNSAIPFLSLFQFITEKCLGGGINFPLLLFPIFFSFLLFGFYLHKRVVRRKFPEDAITGGKGNVMNRVEWGLKVFKGNPWNGKLTHTNTHPKLRKLSKTLFPSYFHRIFQNRDSACASF